MSLSPCCLLYTSHKGENLFPRLDMEKELEYLENERAAKAAAEAPKAEEKKPEPKEEKPEGVASIIEIGDFQKVNLRVAQIKACEPVPKADKLLRLTLDDGTAEGRQVVSGIAPWYKPEDLIGKKIVIVANLKPAKLRGVLSQGMILEMCIRDSPQRHHWYCDPRTDHVQKSPAVPDRYRYRQAV